MTEGKTFDDGKNDQTIESEKFGRRGHENPSWVKITEPLNIFRGTQLVKWFDGKDWFYEDDNGEECLAAEERDLRSLAFDEAESRVWANNHNRGSTVDPQHGSSVMFEDDKSDQAQEYKRLVQIYMNRPSDEGLDVRV